MPQVNAPEPAWSTKVRSSSRSASSRVGSGSWHRSPELSILTVVEVFITVVRCVCLKVSPTEKTRNSNLRACALINMFRALTVDYTVHREG